MLKALIYFTVVASVVTSSCLQPIRSSAPVPPAATASKPQLLWSDDFSGENGAPPDPSKWISEVGGNGFGNNELEYYTSRTANAQIEGGNLVITAQREHYTGRDGVTREYTSARLKTQGHFAQAYGRFEARIKLPQGQGIWPAFWLLGNDIDSVGWPKCGEIDILEMLGHDTSTAYGTIHGPGYSGSNGIQSKFVLPAGQHLSEDFHVFAIEWEPTQIRFYVDNKLYGTRTPAELPTGAKWVYDHPFFILLNLAVGGNWPGNPDATTKFPQKMLVDYVRVYRLK
ncbi:MAG TPA: glycoside hydrolase family 16 protein [Terriglobales bacterium]